MKQIIIAALLACLMLASCGKNTDETNHSDTASSPSSSSQTSAPESSQTVTESASEQDAPASSQPSTDDESQAVDESSDSSASSEPAQETDDTQSETIPAYHTGSVDLSTIPADARSWVYDVRFTSIPFELQYAAGGVGKVEAWAESCDWMINLALFFRDFEMTADQVKEILFEEQTEFPPEITPEEVDILCSDDWAAINNLMVSPYAAASESGDIYTIFWLGEHSAKDYAAAGLDAQAIASAIENTQSLNMQETDVYCKQASQALADYQTSQ